MGCVSVKVLLQVLGMQQLWNLLRKTLSHTCWEAAELALCVTDRVGVGKGRETKAGGESSSLVQGHLSR